MPRPRVAFAHQKPVARLSTVSTIAESILRHGHSLDAKDARATWHRYGIEDNIAMQRLVLDAIDHQGR